jgi:hypothetical protein
MAGRRVSTAHSSVAAFQVKGVWAHARRPALFYTDEWDEAEEAALDMADNGARVTVSERRPPFDDWEPVAFAGEGPNQAWRESRSNGWNRSRRQWHVHAKLHGGELESKTHCGMPPWPRNARCAALRGGQPARRLPDLRERVVGGRLHGCRAERVATSPR